MALARVVSFDGVSADRMAEMREFEGSEPPEGMPPAEFLLLHDPQAEQALAIMLFDNEDDYQKGQEVLEAMPASETPGTRTGVTKYELALRMKS